LSVKTRMKSMLVCDVYWLIGIIGRLLFVFAHPFYIA